MSGDWLALGAVGLGVAAVAAIRRKGSRSMPPIEVLLPQLDVDGVANQALAMQQAQGPIADLRASNYPPTRRFVLLAYLKQLGHSLDSLDLGNGWDVYYEWPGHPSVQRPGTDWHILATPGWEGDWKKLPIQIDSGEGENFCAYEPLLRRRLSGDHYLFNGNLEHDQQVWMDLIRPWADAIDNSQLGTMLASRGELQAGQEAWQINEIVP